MQNQSTKNLYILRMSFEKTWNSEKAFKHNTEKVVPLVILQSKMAEKPILLSTRQPSQQIQGMYCPKAIPQAAYLLIIYIGQLDKPIHFQKT